ncbi:MAG TPA: hypothetical protein VGR35_07660 [Tepidisphaeraceae bacterium]|nr:hypothetical protein [Tepidisphaeraceae bacterium]
MNRLTFLIVLTSFVVPAFAQVDEYERAPIHYSEAVPNDPIAHLKSRIERGEANLEWHDTLGYLPSLLKELDIPASSQGLVFSRTSLQRDNISPKKPRAIYYGDDAYVGYVQDGGLLELAGQDPTLGAVFYTVEQTPPDESRSGSSDPAAPRKGAQIVRQTDNCLSCHGSGMTVEIPGLTLRSVFPDERGSAILAGGTKVATHATPLERRWGGWYLTGSTGVRTMANTRFKPNKGLNDPIPLDGTGGELSDLSSHIDTSKYLTPHSDPVALMLMEHQVEAHNRLAYAAQATLRALHDEKVINDALGETRAPGTHNDSTMSRIRNGCEPLVEYLLFCEEAALTAPITGTSDFAKEFPRRGTRDAKGRSLRDLDLKTRLLRYPLSYLIYSPTFDGLPELAKQRVYQRLWAVLSGADTSKQFAHLSPEDRRAIVEILRETKPDLPAYWKRSP